MRSSTAILTYNIYIYIELLRPLPNELGEEVAHLNRDCMAKNITTSNYNKLHPVP